MSLGNWIVKESRGKFYPCKPDIFEQTYEREHPEEGGAKMKEVYCKVNEAPINKPPLTGIEIITQERERQLSQEGWSAQHDDNHPRGHLALAGACYALDFALYNRTALRLWPWGNEWWKPPKRDTIPESIHELAKAGALIAAEIDKLQRQWEFQKRTIKDKESNP